MIEKISILIPNYNKGRFLRRCIDSIFQQTSQDWEIYIVDDNSTDHSRAILQDYANHPKIHLSFNSQNLGCAASLHQLILQSKNDIVCFLGSDDGLASTCVEEVLKFYREHPNAGFVYTNFFVCDSELRKQNPGWSRALPKGKTSLEVDCISALQTFRRSIYLKTPGLNTKLKGAVDKDLILKLEEVATPLHIPKPLYLYRSLPHSLSRGSNFQEALNGYGIAKQEARKRRSKKKSKIELTVALPIFRGKHIAWLALESLVRQKNINFDWELLIIEEEEFSFGREQIEDYREAFAKIRCQRLEYNSLKNWQPLSRKWYQLAQQASNSSLCFLLQAADCYSQPFRLKETYDLFKQQKPDWVQAQLGPFYDIATDITVLFKGKGNTGLNMAIRTDLMKRLPLIDRRFSIDSWIFHTLKTIVKRKLKVSLLTSKNWLKGFDSNGLNNISNTRGKLMRKCHYPFVKHKIDLSKHIPREVWIRLKRCKSLVSENLFISQKAKETLMKIKTNICDKHITFLWPHFLKHMNRKNLTIVYTEKVIHTPRHLANFMCGIIMSEHFAWNNIPIEFDELTQKEVDCINDHVRLNHASNSYGLVKTKSPVKVSAKKIVEAEEVKNTGPILCSNGMGKDGLLLSLLVKELGFPLKSFIVGNQYIAVSRGEEVWAERKKAMVGFYKQNNISSLYIKTDFVRNGYKIIPWWLFALPLAHAYGSNTILTALNTPDSKVWVRDNTPIRTNSSVFHFDSISKATGYEINCPFWGLAHYGMQTLLIKRYPDSMKWQRSCMLGFPNCGQCGKCYGINSFIQALGENPRKWGFPRMRIGSMNPMTFNPMIKDDVYNTDKKVKKQPYATWIEELNINAHKFSWKPELTKSIFNQYFKDTIKDPGSIDGVCTALPSKWEYWMGEGYNQFWKRP